MARRRRPGSRTSVVDGRAQIIIPLDSFETADESELTWRNAKRWLRPVKSLSAQPETAMSVSLTVDRFAYDVHLANVAHESDTHEGVAFLDAARTWGQATVFVVDQLDPRRSTPTDFDEAVRSGRVIGGIVPAFPVDAIDP